LSNLEVPCRCGDVLIEISGAPIVQFYCHCDDCQTVHGGAYVPESVYPADAVRVARGNPSTWKLRRNPRVTCTACGSRLFVDVLSFRLRGVNGYLLPAGQFNAAFHVQCKFAVRPIKDELPHYKSMPARFGGSDETVGW
jgi:hypothetical protein